MKAFLIFKIHYDCKDCWVSQNYILMTLLEPLKVFQIWFINKKFLVMGFRKIGSQNYKIVKDKSIATFNGVKIGRSILSVTPFTLK